MSNPTFEYQGSTYALVQQEKPLVVCDGCAFKNNGEACWTAGDCRPDDVNHIYVEKADD